ncbi:SGNH hydrolase-type esterase domain-containing protein [Zopfochytrium polystomum]|nr:SGNH hydrolase-type esterase domain-containing protein [Zopfochytrium polystomum]
MRRIAPRNPNFRFLSHFGEAWLATFPSTRSYSLETLSRRCVNLAVTWNSENPPLTITPQLSFDVDDGGWGARLQSAYVRKLDVLNRGYAGFTSDWCKHFFEETLRSTPPQPPAGQPAFAKVALVTLFLGANDCVLPDVNPRQHVPREVFKANLKGMLRQTHEIAPHARAVLLSTPPILPVKWEPHCFERGRALDRSVERTRSYRDACLEVVDEMHEEDPGSKVWLRGLDTWEVLLGEGAVWSAERCDSLLTDGLHFGWEANKLVAEALLRLCKTEWPAELDPDTLIPRVPTHDVIDVTGFPASAFCNARK